MNRAPFDPLRSELYDEDGERLPERGDDRLANETRLLLAEGYPRRIARKMARRRCGYAS